jgi:hypothetical protein
MADAREPMFRSRGPWFLLFAALFALCYALHGDRISPDPASPGRVFLLTGDEPHYLLVAHSLAFDGDLDLDNNRRERDYRLFYDKPVSGYTKSKAWLLERLPARSSLRAQPDAYWARRALPTQPVGVSALIAPAYRLGAAWGGRVRYTVALLFHALASALALVVAALCWRFTGSRAVSLLVAGGFALAAPLISYSVPVFPDLPGALLIALGVLLLARLEDRAGGALTALALGIVSSALPWVHVRFWPSAALLAAAGAWLARGAPRPAATFAWLALPWALSASGLVWYYELLFGVPWPVSMAPPFSLGIGLLSGWPGLLFDRDHGLLAYAPLAAFAVPGAVVLARAPGIVGKVAVALTLGYLGLVGANAGWNGGLSPQLRYWVPVMPLVALAAAAALGSVTAPGPRRLALALGAAGVFVGVWGMLHPRLLYTYRHPVLSRGPWTGLWERLPVFFPEAGAGSLAAAVLGLVALAYFARWVLAAPRR